MKLSIAAVVLAVAALGFALFGGSSPVVQTPLGASAGPDVFTYLNVHGWFSEGGITSTVTPTSATVTLTAAQMESAKVITFAASSTMPALTATLPASTTFPLAREAGAYRTWVIDNPFTAAATTTTIAATTGVDLQEPDGQNVVIGVDNYAWLTCFRLATTDIACRVDETIPAD